MSFDPMNYRGTGRRVTPSELYKVRLEATFDLSFRLAIGSGFRAPWTDVDRMLGMPLLPGWLVLVGARAKGGKSTLLRALFQAWIELGRRVLYVGTEQNASLLGLLVAAEKLGIPARLALDPTCREHFKVLAEVDTVQRELRDIAVIMSESDLSVATFARWCQWAAEEGCDAVLLDHFHRIGASTSNRYEERSEAIRTIKTIGEKRDLLIVAAAQLRNAEGPLGEYEVPHIGSWAETANLRRECDVAVQAWRPLKRGVTNRDRALAREVPGYLPKLLQRNVMGLRLDAHRYNPDDERPWCRLTVANGALTSYANDGSDMLTPDQQDL
jgi:hypothetical protein